MLASPPRFPRSIVTLGVYSLCLAAAIATGCGDSSDGDDGGDGKGGEAGDGGSSGTSGSAGQGGSAGKGGGAGKGGSSGASGAAGKGGSATGGAGGAPGGQGGAGEPGGAGGEGGGVTVSGATCKVIHGSDPSAPTGVYVIDPTGNPGAPFRVVCDMTTSGGGWTLGFIKNSVHNGNYADFGSSYVDVSAVETAPADSSASTFTTAVAGWLDLNAFPYSELRLSGYRNGAETYTSEIILKNTLRLAFGQNGYFLYNDTHGYYWCGGDNDFTTNGVGQENKPTGAPDDCKGHTMLGNGWDFSASNTANLGLTICGGGSVLMTTHPASGFVFYGSPGGAQAIWVR